MRTVKVSELMVSFVHKFAVYVVICLWITWSVVWFYKKALSIYKTMAAKSLLFTNSLTMHWPKVC